MFLMLLIIKSIMPCVREKYIIKKLLYFLEKRAKLDFRSTKYIFYFRQILRRLWLELGLPVFGIFDADPYGLEIMLVYRFGSKVMAW